MKALWNETYTREVARILETYSDRVMIEVCGHEHLADVRYSNGSVIFNESSGFTGPQRYHNMIINPGVTSFDGQNPGFTLFNIDLDK